tara:strand:+ start:1659 stop:3023 length:1365 start_codon:yes stop_codon:yes gene_type:complete
MLAKGIKKVLSATKGPGPKRSRRKATSKPLSAKEKQRLAESNKRFKKLMEGTEFNPKAQKRKALKGLQLEAQRKAKKAKRGVDKKKQAAVKKKIIENKKRIRKKSQKDSYGGIDTLLENLIIPYKGTKDKTVKRMSGGLIKLGKKLVSPKPKPRTRKPPISPPKEKSIDDLFIKDPMFLKKLAGQLGITVSELKKRRAKAKKAKRGVDKKKQAEVKKRIAAKPDVKKRKQQDAQIAAIKKEREKKPRQNIVAREGQAVTSKNKNPDAVFTSGDNKLVRGKRSDPYILDNMSSAQKNRAKKIVALEAKKSAGTITKKETAELKKLDKINRDDYNRMQRKAAFSRGEKNRKARLEAALKRKRGGPTNPISTKGSYGGKASGKKVAKADWMEGLTPAEIQQILGGPTKDASGVIRHSKKKTKKKKKVVKAMGGRKVLYRSIGGKVIDGNDILKMIYD